MREVLEEALWRELSLRGFVDGVAPNDSIAFSHEYLRVVEVTQLLSAMAARSEKVRHSMPVVGQQLALEAIEDVDLAISAISAVIERFLASSVQSADESKVP